MTCSKDILFCTNDISYYLLSHIQYNILVAQFREQIEFETFAEILMLGILELKTCFTKYKSVCSLCMIIDIRQSLSM